MVFLGVLTCYPNLRLHLHRVFSVLVSKSPLLKIRTLVIRIRTHPT